MAGLHSQFRRLLPKLALASGSFVVCLLVAEALVRIAVDEGVWRFRDATDDWQLDRRLGWVQRGNLDVTSPGPDGRLLSFKTNPDGLQPHTAARKQPPGTLRILLVGDSVVVGRSVEETGRLHRQLERELLKLGIKAEVLNAGVQGYSTDQDAIRLEQLLPLYAPQVVVYALCENDFGGNVSSEAYGLPKPYFVLSADGSLSERAPSRTPSQIARFGNNGPSAWVQYSALYRALQPGIATLRAQLGGWRERNLMGLADDYYYDAHALEALSWPMLRALLARMRRSAENHGAELWVYAYPGLGTVWNPVIENTVRKRGLRPSQYRRGALEDRLASEAAQVGIKSVQLAPYFASQQRRGPFHLLPRDPHNNATGYALTAEVLAKAIAQSAGTRAR